jgi:hypothetical protein
VVRVGGKWYGSAWHSGPSSTSLNIGALQVIAIGEKHTFTLALALPLPCVAGVCCVWGTKDAINTASRDDVQHGTLVRFFLRAPIPFARELVVQHDVRLRRVSSSF